MYILLLQKSVLGLFLVILSQYHTQPCPPPTHTPLCCFKSVWGLLWLTLGPGIHRCPVVITARLSHRVVSVLKLLSGWKWRMWTTIRPSLIRRPTWQASVARPRQALRSSACWPVTGTLGRTGPWPMNSSQETRCHSSPLTPLQVCDLGTASPERPRGLHCVSETGWGFVSQDQDEFHFCSPRSWDP